MAPRQNIPLRPPYAVRPPGSPSKSSKTASPLRHRRPTATTYDVWRQQTFHLDDAAVAQRRQPHRYRDRPWPANASFGSHDRLADRRSPTTPYRGDGYSVAIIDTGIDYNNPTSAAAGAHRVIAGWDFVNNDADPMDDNGHGTHVAGIIGSSSDATYSGIAPNVNLIALKVLDATGSGTFGNVETPSMGRRQPGQVQHRRHQPVARLRQLHHQSVHLPRQRFQRRSRPTACSSPSPPATAITPTAAAGPRLSRGRSATSSPSAPSGTATSAPWPGRQRRRDNTTAADRIASFSQRGAGLSIMAPGAMITSTYLDNTFESMAGTSMASPVVAGSAVLIHQALDANLHVTRQPGHHPQRHESDRRHAHRRRPRKRQRRQHRPETFKRLDLGAALAAIGAPADSGPSLQAIANQNVAPGQSVTITLSGNDADGDVLTYSASVLGGSQSQAYLLDQQLGLKYLGTYYTNAWGQNEKWLSSTSGELVLHPRQRPAPDPACSMPTTLQAAALVATLDPSVYANPALLWNRAAQ